MLLLCFKILQWIPIAFIIKSKILTITHKALLEYDLYLSFQASLVSLSCMLIIHWLVDAFNTLSFFLPENP